MIDDLFADLDRMAAHIRKGAPSTTASELDTLDKVGQSRSAQPIENVTFGQIGQFGQSAEVGPSSTDFMSTLVDRLSPTPPYEERARDESHIELSKLSNLSKPLDGRGLAETELSKNSANLSNLSITPEDVADAFEERAAVLEFDEGLTRAEAEALAAAETGYVRPPPPAPPARADWRTRMHVSGPGVTITAPAILVPVAEYDAHLDGMIAAAGEGTTEASVLRQKKRKGNVVERGGERIYVMGRA